ncbi:MAG: PAS domain S-box protein [Leptolyngbya sp. PLA1]|nr:PAS domain S-box protein [Leptolyngbya sp. PLA1]
MAHLRALDARSGGVRVVHAEPTPAELMELKRDLDGPSAALIAVLEGEKFRGLVRATDLHAAGAGLSVGELALRSSCMRVKPDAVLDDVRRDMEREAQSAAAIVDEAGTYWGTVTREDVMAALAAAADRGVEPCESAAHAGGSQLPDERTLTEQALSHVGAVLVVLDEHGRIRRFSREAERISGYRFEEVEGRCPWDLMLPTEQSAIIRAEAFEAAMRDSDDRTTCYTNEWVSRTGVRRLLEWRNTCLRDAGGRATFMVSVGIDVTERRRTEQSLAEIRERYRYALEGTQDGLWDWNVQTGVAYHSPRWCEILGFQPEEVRPSAEFFFERLHPDDLGSLLAATEEHLAGKRPLIASDVRIRRKCGEWVWVQSRARIATRDGAGRPVRLVGAITDIHAQKLAELAQREAEARFRLIANSLAEVFWIAEPRTGRLLYVSPSYESVWRRPVAGVYADWKSSLEAVHPEDRDRVRCVLHARSTTPRYEMEYRLVWPDGTVRWIWDRGYPVVGSSGREDRCVGIALDITERKRAEAALALSESRLREAHQLAGLGAWELDLATQTLWWSPEQYRLIGIPEGTAVTQSLFLSLIHPDNRAAFDEHFRRLMAEGTVECTYRIRRPDGRVRHMHGVASVVREPAGEARCVRGTNRDITEQVLADTALRQSEGRFRRIFEFYPECVKLVDRDCRLLDMNPAGLKMIEAGSLEEVRGTSVLDLIAPEHRAAYATDVERIFGGGGSGVSTFRAIGRRGASRWMEQYSIGLPSPEDPGRVHRMLSVTRDITDRKRAEEELRQGAARLLEAQRIGRMGSWELNLGTGELRWSATIFEIFEIDSTRFAATYETFLAAIHPDDRVRVDLAYKSSVRDRQPYEITHRLLMPDGRVKHVRERGETFYDEAGAPLRSMGTVQDITDQTQYEAKLAAAARREMVATIAGGIAHEFNSMLLAAALHLHGARDGAGERGSAVDKAASLIQQVQSLSASLLDVFAGPDGATVDTLDLRHWLPETVEKLSDLMLPRASVTVAPVAGPAEVRADALVLEQVLRILLGNASEAIGPGGRIDVEARAWACERGGGHGVEIRVSDDGPGIPESDRERVFDPFFSTKKRARRSGLGLAIALRLVEQSGGRLYFEPNHPRGSVFVIRLNAVEHGVA